MAKRGRPRREQAVDTSAGKPNNPEIEMKPNVSIASGLIPDEARDEMYDSFEKFRIEQSGLEPQEEEQVATEPEQKVEGEPEPKIQEAAEAPAEQEQTQATEKEPEKYVKEEVKEPQKEDKIEKTVPLAALHEARNEVKELKRRLADLERNQIIEPQAQTDDDYEYATKKEIQSIRQELEQRKHEEMRIKLDRNIEVTDNSLKTQNIFGFKEFGTVIVTDRLNRMYQDDPELCIAHDNPEGWAKIWREEYPKFKQMFVQQDMQAALAEKAQRKSSAGMVGSPGLKTESIGAEKPKVAQTREDANLEYVQWRKSGLL